jgi:hypothetical protein
VRISAREAGGDSGGKIVKLTRNNRLQRIVTDQSHLTLAEQRSLNSGRPLNRDVMGRSDHLYASL